MKKRISTIKNKRFVTGNDPNEVTENEILITVDENTGKLSLSERIDGEIVESAGTSNIEGVDENNDGPLEGAVELGLQDGFYNNDTFIDLSSTPDGELINHTFNPSANVSIFKQDQLKDIPESIWSKCYIKGRVVDEAKYSPSNISLVYSQDSGTGKEGETWELEIRTALKKHTVHVKLRDDYAGRFAAYTIATS